jgi:uncharacterized protein YajQ (UPF0234 family)
MVQNVAVTTTAIPDTTAPSTTAGPSVSGTSGTATTLSVTINEDGTGYYLVLPAADASPTAAAVQAGIAFAMTANVVATPAISGLAASTAYKIFFVAKDTANNVQAAVQSVAVNTTAVPDTTAPTTTGGPSVSGTSTSGTTLSVTINENGTGYYLVQPSANAAPAVAAVQAGTHFAMTANVAATPVISGLTSNTAYKIYFVAKDAANNVQATVQSVAVTTAVDTTPPISTMAPGIYVDSAGVDSFSVTINENGIGFYYLLPLTTPIPTVTPATIKANARGGVTMAATPAYILYFVAQDAAGNLQPTVQVATRTAGYVVQGGLIWSPWYAFYDTWQTMSTNCTTQWLNGQSGWRLPTSAELIALYNSAAVLKQGTTLWSTTSPSAGTHNVINMNDGVVVPFNDSAVGASASCVR